MAEGGLFDCLEMLFPWLGQGQGAALQYDAIPRRELQSRVITIHDGISIIDTTPVDSRRG